MLSCTWAPPVSTPTMTRSKAVTVNLKGKFFIRAYFQTELVTAAMRPPRLLPPHRMEYWRGRHCPGHQAHKRTGDRPPAWTETSLPRHPPCFEIPDRANARVWIRNHRLWIVPYFL